MSARRPPRKKKKTDEGWTPHPRRLDGDLLDVATAARAIGDTEKGARSKIARGLLPHRRLGGRIVLLRDELHAFLRQLPGVTVAQALENVATRQGEAAR